MNYALVKCWVQLLISKHLSSIRIIRRYARRRSRLTSLRERLFGVPSFRNITSRWSTHLGKKVYWQMPSLADQLMILLMVTTLLSPTEDFISVTHPRDSQCVALLHARGSDKVQRLGHLFVDTVACEPTSIFHWSWSVVISHRCNGYFSHCCASRWGFKVSNPLWGSWYSLQWAIGPEKDL